MRLVFALLASALMSGPSLCSPGSTSKDTSTTTGTPQQPPSMDEPCLDTQALIDVCSMALTSPCPGGLPSEYAPACRAGCMLETCPKQVTCVEVKTLGVACGNCADVHDAIFWEDLINLGEGCSNLVFDPSHPATAAEQAEFGKCLAMLMEQNCPALVGTGWESKLPGATK